MPAVITYWLQLHPVGEGLRAVCGLLQQCARYNACAWHASNLLHAPLPLPYAVEPGEFLRDGGDDGPVALHVVVQLEERHGEQLQVPRNREGSLLWKGNDEELLALLWLGDVRRDVRVQHRFKVWPPPRSHALANLQPSCTHAPSQHHSLPPREHPFDGAGPRSQPAGPTSHVCSSLSCGVSSFDDSFRLSPSTSAGTRVAQVRQQPLEGTMRVRSESV
eukprot:scaffold5847_cov417-Prasinococcus_capsulatus_cf.AAC.2